MTLPAPVHNAHRRSRYAAARERAARAQLARFVAAYGRSARLVVNGDAYFAHGADGQSWSFGSLRSLEARGWIEKRVEGSEIEVEVIHE